MNFSKLKDALPTHQRSDVVYCITCQCNRRYVGQCSTTVRQRITLHRSDSNLRPNRCTLAAHVAKTGHRPGYDDVKILAEEKHLGKRLFLEMCHINEQEDSINSKTDLDNLNTIYSFLLQRDFHNRDTRRTAQVPTAEDASTSEEEYATHHTHT